MTVKESKSVTKAPICGMTLDEANTNHTARKKETQMKLVLKPLSVAVLIAVVLHLGPAFAQITGVSTRPKTSVSQTHQASSLAAAARAKPLADGAEIFENLTEAAPVMGAAAFKKALSEYEKLYPKIYPRLSPDRKMRLDTLVTGVRNAWQKGDRGAMAIQSIEAYRLLQESINRNGQRVPVEVPLLDYAGFKLNGLLLSTQPDWKAVAKTAQEASKWWSAIGPKIADKTLRNAMDHTINGLKRAAVRKDAKLLRSVAAKDLTLVDGLETYFSSHPLTRHR
jgi:hypothetical protein